MSKQQTAIAALVLAACLGAFSAARAASGTSSLEITYDPAAFTAPATLTVTIGTSTPGNLSWQETALSPTYDYSFTTTGLYDPSRPLTVKIHYNTTNSGRKQIYSQDSISGVWRALPTGDDPTDRYATSTTDSLSGGLILLADTQAMSVGQASWYKYKNGLFAASPDYAKGSVLRVTNLDNGKSVNITVNDFGPERALYPNRVLDLDYVAFRKIAPAGAGIINVKVEPLKIVVPPIVKALPQTAGTPNITATSAIVILEKTGQTLWAKDADRVSPLASLSKLIAAQVFLNTKPNLNKVVTYKVQDEKYNAQYAAPEDSARLRVKNGDTLTIRNLLYSAIVGSANNAIESLVRVSGLARPDFIAAMNDAAQEWGATDTHFVEPTGLSPQNVSSPRDYAIISRVVLADKLLAEISVTQRYTFTTINTKKKHVLSNTDQLLRGVPYKITGSKTGYLDEAGHCLMTRAQTPQGSLIAVNFGSVSAAANFQDNETLIQYAQSVLKNK